ncbi:MULTISPECIES: hypothetical protein [Bombella]|uniref:Uncharacterized protein n=1 Tax=Bombella pollinis TaxID=2967337 RepID=A0ABT3WLV9_9PROT|nr:MULTISPECIES: hypothetical protein [Bombella]MCX5619279.1 hypothetical protein [Bombella pollinis]
MAQKAFRVADRAATASSAQQGSAIIIPFRQKILPRHHHYLAQWLTASEPMGILDASIETMVEEPSPLIVIWVRENADPAYLIRLEGPQWVLMDCLREHELGRYTDLSAALHTIRPVLPLSPEHTASC